jgi:hypothetical protein
MVHLSFALPGMPGPQVMKVPYPLLLHLLLRQEAGAAAPNTRVHSGRQAGPQRSEVRVMTLLELKTPQGISCQLR